MAIWWIVPTTLTVLGIIAGLIASFRWTDRGIGMASFIFGFVAFICWIVFPITYFDNRDTVWKMESYYDNIVAPHIISTSPEYVTVRNLEAAVWQSGQYNLADYDREVALQKRRQVTFWGRLSMYQLPGTYKFAQVAEADK